MNGTDSLSYLDIQAGNIVPFIEIGDPNVPTLTTDGTAGSGFNVYYRITANSTNGESAASPELTVDVAKPRSNWVSPANGGTDYVTIAWTAVPSAQSYNIYMSEVQNTEVLIASKVGGLSFTDDGSFQLDYARPYPTVNSTAGPKVTHGENINGRAWFVGDDDNPYYVWRGGDPGYELDFSPANGGGYTPVGQGSKDIPVAVKAFRDGRGLPQISVLCDGTNGSGKRFIIAPDQITLNDDVLSFYSVNEEASQDGTKSPDAVITYGTDLHYPSRDGFKTTGTLPSLQNVLSTKRTSNTIQDDIAQLNQNAMSKAVGVAFEGRLYYAVPVNSTSNSEIWVLDLDRKGAWMKPWSIRADWMWLYNDNEGTTHHMILQDNRMYELSYSSLTQDDGEAFSTLGSSGQIYFSEDKRMWVQLLAAIFVLGNAQGQITFSVTGKTEDDPVIGLGDPFTFNPEAQTTVAGWGEPNPYVPGWGQNDWSQVGEVPESITEATQEALIEIDEEVQWISYDWSSVGVGVDYELSDVILEYIEVGIKDLS